MLIRLKPREGSHLALDHGDVSHGEALCGSTPEHACMFGSVVGALLDMLACLEVFRIDYDRTCLHGRKCRFGVETNMLAWS
jgi:hypothetical protein